MPSVCIISMLSGLAVKELLLARRASMGSDCACMGSMSLTVVSLMPLITLVTLASRPLSVEAPASFLCFCSKRVLSSAAKSFRRRSTALRKPHNRNPSVSRGAEGAERVNEDRKQR
jgi:hypothetical protein